MLDDSDYFAGYNSRRKENWVRETGSLTQFCFHNHITFDFWLTAFILFSLLISEKNITFAR